jgi:hypothetical protein
VKRFTKKKIRIACSTGEQLVLSKEKKSKTPVAWDQAPNIHMVKQKKKEKREV